MVNPVDHPERRTDRRQLFRRLLGAEAPATPPAADDAPGAATAAQDDPWVANAAAARRRNEAPAEIPAVRRDD